MNYNDFKDGYRNQRDWTMSVLSAGDIPLPSVVPMIPLRAFKDDLSYVLGMEAYVATHPFRAGKTFCIAMQRLATIDAALLQAHHDTLADAAFRVSPLRMRAELKRRYYDDLPALLADKRCPDKI